MSSKETPPTASVKRVETVDVQTPWLDVICLWRADARDRRRRIRAATRAALAAERGDQ